MRRSLVEKALDKAAECEAKGDKEGMERWLAFAERADKVYSRHAKN